MTKLQTHLESNQVPPIQTQPCPACNGVGTIITEPVHAGYLKVDSRNAKRLSRILSAHGFYFELVGSAGPLQPDVDWYEIGCHGFVDENGKQMVNRQGRPIHNVAEGTR